MKLRIKKGDRFETLAAISTFGLSAWNTSHTGNFRCTLPQGLQLRVSENPAEGRTAFCVVPVEYEKMEKELVPAKIRNAHRYSGYYFIFDHQDIGAVLKKAEHAKHE